MSDKPVILLLEMDAVARHPLAQYLRECGYMVVEAKDTDEARACFQGPNLIEIAFLDVRASGAEDAFRLARWIRSHHRADVVMVGGLEKAATKASELCQAGPKLTRPYEHTNVVDLIKQLHAARDRAGVQIHAGAPID